MFSVIVVYKKLVKQTTNHIIKSAKLDQNISIETLSKYFKPITLEINHFEIRRINNIHWTFLYVQLISTFDTGKGANKSAVKRISAEFDFNSWILTRFLA